MKIALICGSPKGANSASHVLLQTLQNSFPAGTGCQEFYLNQSQVPEAALSELNNFDALVFAYPLYVDGMPAHLLSCLQQLETSFTNKQRIYAIVNCGFYEGEQTRHAIGILRNWCRKSGLTWGMGVGIGGGGALFSLGSLTLGQGPTKSVGKALQTMLSCILSRKTCDDLFTTVNMPRFFYKTAGELGWRQGIKKNGGTAKDLDKRW